MKMYRIIIAIFACMFFVSCGIKSYRTFELPKTDYSERMTLFSDSLIDLKIGTSVYDCSRDFTIFITSVLKEKTELVIDSIFVNAIFLPNKLETNYYLNEVFVNNNDTLAYFQNFKSIPSDIKLFNQKGKSILYSLTYWDLLSEPTNIPETVKEIDLEIYIKYSLDNIIYEKNFTVNLQSKTHRYFWILRDD